jgi:hypothetical protein
MNKVIVVDSGRQFVKCICEGKRLMFQSVLAPAPSRFNLDLKTLPTDLWVEYKGKGYLIGDFAIRQSENGLQERSDDKTNAQNTLMIATACSVFANRGDKITLLTNCPTRDWGKQKEKLNQAFLGWYSVTHKAGQLKGKTAEFSITETHAFPEGEMAFFGSIYDSDLNVINPEYLNSNVLILDIGDQTCNYISFNAGCEPFDAGSGSLNLGMFTTYSRIQAWLEQQGVEITQPKLADCIIKRKEIYSGKNLLPLNGELMRSYDQLANEIFNQLSSRLKWNRYQYILITGGGGFSIFPPLYNKLSCICEVRCNQFNAQWLNAEGADRIYKLSKIA